MLILKRIIHNTIWGGPKISQLAGVEGDKIGHLYSLYCREGISNEILNGKRPVSIEYALYLEAALGIDAQLWIQMQADYNLQVAKSDRKINRHLLEIRKIAAAL